MAVRKHAFVPELLHPYKAEPAEDFEEREEREEPEVKKPQAPVKKARKPIRQNFNGTWSNFFYEPLDIEYSLTQRRIAKPRINLLCKNEYVVARN